MRRPSTDGLTNVLLAGVVAFAFWREWQEYGWWAVPIGAGLVVLALLVFKVIFTVVEWDIDRKRRRRS